MRHPLICELVVEYPAKVALAGYLAFHLNILPRQMGFGGVSRVPLGHFTPPNTFWRGISEHKFNSHIKQAASKPENPFLVLIQPLYITKYRFWLTCFFSMLARHGRHTARRL